MGRVDLCAAALTYEVVGESGRVLESTGQRGELTNDDVQLRVFIRPSTHADRYGVVGQRARLVRHA
jgi:hypothetical protein